MKKGLTQAEVAKVFAMYLGCEIYKNGTTLILVNMEDSEYGILEDDGFSSRVLSFTNTLPKLLLTPLSKITDEDAIEVSVIYNKFMAGSTNREKILMGKHLVKQGRSGEVWMVREYLISKGYAVPIWFGIDHWANGLTAIELNLAIDTTTLNNHESK